MKINIKQEEKTKETGQRQRQRHIDKYKKTNTLSFIRWSSVSIVSCSLESLLVIPDNFLSEYVDHARQLTMDTRSSKKVLAYPSRQDVLPVCSLSLQSHPHCPTGSSSGVIVRCGSWRTLVNHQRLRLCPRVNPPKASLSVPISLPATGDDS